MLKSGTPDEIYYELLKFGAKHAYVDGGRTIQQFLNASFADEMIIARIPILIGSGIPLFGSLNHDIKFAHIETKSFGHSLVKS